MQNAMVVEIAAGLIVLPVMYAVVAVEAGVTGSAQAVAKTVAHIALLLVELIALVVVQVAPVAAPLAQGVPLVVVATLAAAQVANLVA